MSDATKGLLAGMMAAAEELAYTPRRPPVCQGCGSAFFRGFRNQLTHCKTCRPEDYATPEPPPLTPFTYMLEGGRVQLVVGEGATREGLAAARRFIDMMLRIDGAKP